VEVWFDENDAPCSVGSLDSVGPTVLLPWATAATCLHLGRVSMQSKAEKKQGCPTRPPPDAVHVSNKHLFTRWKSQCMLWSAVTVAS